LAQAEHKAEQRIGFDKNLFGATMEADGDSSTMGEPGSWENFKLEPTVSVVYSEHSEPTELLRAALGRHPEPDRVLAYDSPYKLFEKSSQMAQDAIEDNDTLDPLEAWEDIFRECFQGESNLHENTVERVIQHGLRLVRTPPTFFGNACELQPADEQRAVFKFLPLSEQSVPISRQEALRPYLNHRHDIVQWIASIRTLFKVYNVDDLLMAAVSVEPLIVAPNPDRHVLKVVRGSEVMMVTKESWDAMDHAIASMANQPGPFLKAKFAVIAVTKILGKDLLEYSMPETPSEIQDFDWDMVVLGRACVHIPRGNSLRVLTLRESVQFTTK
jgi:hypothetical protein